MELHVLSSSTLSSGGFDRPDGGRRRRQKTHNGNGGEAFLKGPPIAAGRRKGQQRGRKRSGKPVSARLAQDIASAPSQKSLRGIQDFHRASTSQPPDDATKGASRVAPDCYQEAIASGTPDVHVKQFEPIEDSARGRARPISQEQHLHQDPG